MGARCNTQDDVPTDGRARADAGAGSRGHRRRGRGLLQLAHAAAQGQARRARPRHVCRQRRDAGPRAVHEGPEARRVRAGVRSPRRRRRVGLGHRLRARDRPPGDAGGHLGRRLRRQQDVPHRRSGAARGARDPPADRRTAHRHPARAAVELSRVHGASELRRAQRQAPRRGGRADARSGVQGTRARRAEPFRQAWHRRLPGGSAVADLSARRRARLRARPRGQHRRAALRRRGAMPSS
jgi:hypothetical protein